MGMSITARSANADAYLSHDETFHQTVLLASGNAMFAGMTHVVTAVLQGRTRHALMPEVAEPEALAFHAAAASANQFGDGDAAEHAMRGIVQESATAIETIAAGSR